MLGTGSQTRGWALVQGQGCRGGGAAAPGKAPGCGLTRTNRSFRSGSCPLASAHTHLPALRAPALPASHAALGLPFTRLAGAGAGCAVWEASVRLEGRRWLSWGCLQCELRAEKPVQHADSVFALQALLQGPGQVRRRAPPPLDSRTRAQPAPSHKARPSSVPPAPPPPGRGIHALCQGLT